MNQVKFNKQSYDVYQHSVMAYRKRQAALLRDEYSHAERVAQVLGIDLIENPDVFAEVRVPEDRTRQRTGGPQTDNTGVYIIKFNDTSLAQEILTKRATLLRNIGSFNVQLSYEDRQAIPNLTKLKNQNKIAGFGQNSAGHIYVAFWSKGFDTNRGSPNASDDMERSGPGEMMKEYVVLNSPLYDSRLPNADEFRKLDKGGGFERVYIEHNQDSGQYRVIDLDTSFSGQSYDKELVNLLKKLNSKKPATPTHPGMEDEKEDSGNLSNGEPGDGRGERRYMNHLLAHPNGSTPSPTHMHGLGEEQIRASMAYAAHAHYRQSGGKGDSYSDRKGKPDDADARYYEKSGLEGLRDAALKYYMDQIDKLKNGSREDWVEAIMSVRHLAPFLHPMSPEYGYRKDSMRRPPGLPHPMMTPMAPYPREMMAPARGVPADFYPPYGYRYPPAPEDWRTRHHMPRRSYRNELWSDPLKQTGHPTNPLAAKDGENGLPKDGDYTSPFAHPMMMKGSGKGVDYDWGKTESAFPNLNRYEMDLKNADMSPQSMERAQLDALNELAGENNSHPHREPSVEAPSLNNEEERIAEVKREARSHSRSPSRKRNRDRGSRRYSRSPKRKSSSKDDRRYGGRRGWDEPSTSKSSKSSGRVETVRDKDRSKKSKR